jgi:hypothetical protein
MQQQVLTPYARLEEMPEVDTEDMYNITLNKSEWDSERAIWMSRWGDTAFMVQSANIITDKLFPTGYMLAPVAILNKHAITAKNYEFDEVSEFLEFVADKDWYLYDVYSRTTRPGFNFRCVISECIILSIPVQSTDTENRSFTLKFEKDSNSNWNCTASEEFLVDVQKLLVNNPVV